MIVFFSLSLFLFIIGSMGLFILRKHAIMLLICLEILILAININFVTSAIFLDDLSGLVYSLINLTSAASESALGLGLLILFYRIKGSISLDLIILLKT
jgi:NADH-quinone oxidoreductase subunit K